jgi:hypothetical protein
MNAPVIRKPIQPPPQREREPVSIGEAAENVVANLRKKMDERTHG